MSYLVANSGDRFSHDEAQLLYACLSPVCPSGWEKNRRSCYKFITDLKYQFAAAAKHCETLNSHLLHIDDQVEDKYIKKRVKKKYPRVEVWRTGGRKFGKEFAWYTGQSF